MLKSTPAHAPDALPGAFARSVDVWEIPGAFRRDEPFTIDAIEFESQVPNQLAIEGATCAASRLVADVLAQ